MKIENGLVTPSPSTKIERWYKVHFVLLRLYQIYYYGFMRPSFREFYFDDVTEYEAEIIDTWNMTITKEGVYKGKFRINLPGTQYMAIRLKKVKTS